jgi:hypothetical protein
MRRYGLRDDQWDRIKDLLPGREGHVGDIAKDNWLLRAVKKLGETCSSTTGRLCHSYR